MPLPRPPRLPRHFINISALFKDMKTVANKKMMSNLCKVIKYSARLWHN
jgi:hypothetical protein